jgi:hypothetical protein
VSRRSELRSIAYHREIGATLSEDVLALAARNLLRAERMQTTDIRYIVRWRALLAKPLAVIAAELAEDDENMRDLRQCSPFAGALTPQRRWELWASIDESSAERSAK